MQISLRSHLIAGTAAVVGAGAIAINPVMGAQLSLPSINVPAAAQVALAAFDSPLAQLFATLDVANNYLLDPFSNPLVAANWPGANFGTDTFGGPPGNYPLLPAALADPALGGYSSVGVVSQFIDDALPIISQLGYNGLDYLNVTGNALFGAGAELTQSLWTAGGLLLQGNIPGALATVSAAITTAGQALLLAGGYVFNNVIAKASAVVATLVGSLPQLLAVTAAQAAVVAASATAVITNTVTALSLGNLEGAWNAAVDGLLGPSGIPGTLLNLSIGAGIQTGPIITPDAAGIAAVFVPSTRTLVQGLSNEIVADLQVQAPAASVPAARSARSAASVRAAAVKAAPAAEAATGDSAAATGDSAAAAGDSAAAADSAVAATEAPAEKPVSNRSARKAASR